MLEFPLTWPIFSPQYYVVGSAFTVIAPFRRHFDFCYVSYPIKHWYIDDDIYVWMVSLETSFFWALQTFRNSDGLSVVFRGPMGLSPLYYTASFIEIGPPVPEKKNFQVIIYMDMVAILVRWPGPFIQISVPPSQSFVDQVYNHLICKRPSDAVKNDFGLEYSHSFISSICCLHLHNCTNCQVTGYKTQF